MLALTNEARESHMQEITKLIDKLGKLKESELDYLSYREIVYYLSTMRNEYRKEILNLKN